MSNFIKFMFSDIHDMLRITKNIKFYKIYINTRATVINEHVSMIDM